MRRKGILCAAIVSSVILLATWMAHARPPGATAKCQSKKVNAASIFVKKLFYAEAAFIKDSNYDKQQALEEAEDEFIQRWNSEEATGQCNFPWGSQITIGRQDDAPVAVSFSKIEELADWIEDEVSAIADLILLATEEQVTQDHETLRNLKAELLKAAGRYAFELLKAESQDLNKPNASRKSQAFARAKRSFEDQYRKRVEKAVRAGVDVGQLDDDSDSDGTYDLLEDIEESELDRLNDIVEMLTATPNGASN